MVVENSFFQDLSETELSEIKSNSITKNFAKDELIFSEGDEVDSFYVIESGSVSIHIDKSGKNEQISLLGKGDYFGEMAIFTRDKRTASATARNDTALLCIDKTEFLSFVESNAAVAEKINVVLATRNEELLLKENLIAVTGIDAKKFHVSIKGDPSLRESAFVRERYESMVDKVLPQLIPNLEHLLLNRCIFSLTINFNSGEIRTSSIFDPFNDAIHTVNKLINKSYIERHFPMINYDEKSAFIHRIFDFVSSDDLFNAIPTHLKNIFSKFHDDWQPIEKEEITGVLSQLSTLRSIESFYLRNISIGIIQDAIRMQFNCDGTHFVSSEDYQQFLKDNL